MIGMLPKKYVFPSYVSNILIPPKRLEYFFFLTLFWHSENDKFDSITCFILYLGRYLQQ